MSILYSNKRNLYLKIDNMTILKKALFCESKIKYSVQPNIEGHYELTLFNEKDFTKLKTHYEDEVRHIKFMKRYKSGELEPTFKWIKKMNKLTSN